MKKQVKKKYQNIKPDGQAYEELVSAYEREEMWDYSFKSRSQAIGKNAKKLMRMRALKIVLSILGAVLVLYFGYFIVEVIKGVNSRSQQATQEYVTLTEDARTTVPSTDQSTTVPSTRESTTVPTTKQNTTTAAKEKTTAAAEDTHL
ncbi:MAG: hypothetical protein IJJ41_04265 [Clostridia bacterium]|nr:hypothetical protein [Clostridia bacterium]